MNRAIIPVNKGTFIAYLQQRKLPLSLEDEEYQAALHLLQNPGSQDNVSGLYNLTPKGYSLVRSIVAGARKYREKMCRRGSIFS